MLSQALISRCLQAQHMIRMNQLCEFSYRHLREGDKSVRKTIYQPFSKALRMATSMSWSSSELMWNTVICFPGNQLALINMFPQTFSRCFKNLWYVIYLFIKTNSGIIIRWSVNKRPKECTTSLLQFNFVFSLFSLMCMIFFFLYVINALMYQFLALHALHQSLKEMDGIVLAEVEGFLDGCNDIRFNSIRKTAGDESQLQWHGSNTHRL